MTQWWPSCLTTGPTWVREATSGRGVRPHWRPGFPWWSGFRGSPREARSWAMWWKRWVRCSESYLCMMIDDFFSIHSGNAGQIFTLFIRTCREFNSSAQLILTEHSETQQNLRCLFSFKTFSPRWPRRPVWTPLPLVPLPPPLDGGTRPHSARREGA